MADILNWLGISPEEENPLYNYMYLKKDVEGKASVREPEASVVAVGQVGLKSSKDQDSKQKERLKTAKDIFKRKSN